LEVSFTLVDFKQGVSSRWDVARGMEITPVVTHLTFEAQRHLPDGPPVPDGAVVDPVMLFEVATANSLLVGDISALDLGASFRMTLTREEPPDETKP
jgi:hypothetical protein